MQVKSSGADTEKAREEKLLVIPAGLVRRCVLEERNTYRAANIAFFKFYAPVASRSRRKGQGPRSLVVTPDLAQVLPWALIQRLLSLKSVDIIH